MYLNGNHKNFYFINIILYPKFVSSQIKRYQQNTQMTNFNDTYTKAPLLSVIVLMHNSSSTIERCVKSLCDSEVDNMEVIFVDDASQDQTVNILNNILSATDIPFKYKLIRNSQNLRQAKSRKIAINVAQGKYITHLDSDDWIEPGGYKKLLTFANDNKLDVVCFGRIEEWANSINKFPPVNVSQKENLQKYLLLGKIQGHLHTRIVNREICQAKNIIWPEGNIIEDTVLMFQYFHKANKIGFMQDCLYHYVHTETSTMAKFDSDKERLISNLQEIEQNIRLIEKYCDLNDLKLKHELNYLKYRWKNSTLEFSDNICKYWNSVFKDIGLNIITNPYVGLMSKIRTIALSTYSYGLFRKLGIK